MGRKRTLVAQGRILREALVRESLTEAELDTAAARHQELLDRIDALAREVDRLRTELSPRR